MIQDPILLVDDEEDLRTFLRDALTQDGYQVDEAPDAGTALERMAERHYPVVITDLNMPGGPTGFELIQAVRAKDTASLCVVITGYASMETAIQAVKFGAYDFVQKPFKLAEIEAVLDRALSHATVVGQLQDYQRDLEARVMARVRDIQDLHGEMLRLNELLVASLREREEKPILAAFLEHAEARYRPEGFAAFLPQQDRWRLALDFGPYRPALAELPPPSSLDGAREWTWSGGYPEGHLIPLAGDDQLLGALFLGFQGRSDFQPEAPGFVLWRRQLEAALLGLRRARAMVDQALASGRKA